MAIPSNNSERYKQLLKTLSLPESDVNPAQMVQLKKLLADNTDVFALNDVKLGCTDLVQHAIETGSHSSVKQQPYRTPFSQREKIAQMIKDMKERGIVKLSTSPWASPWASPIILVPKRDGTSRFCIRYRWLNAITTKDVYLFPHIDDTLDILGKAKYYSSP